MAAGEENGTERAGSVSGSLGEASPVTVAGGVKVKHQPGVKRACNDCRQQKVSVARHRGSTGEWMAESGAGRQFLRAVC